VIYVIGLIGVVKFMSEDKARIELPDRIVNVEHRHVAVLQNDCANIMGRTPIWNGAFYEQHLRTPMHRGNTTPVHGFATPTRGCNTPVYYSMGTPAYSSK
jgi:transcription elongation factor